VSLPWRTRAFCTVADLARRRRLADRTLAQIQRSRRLEPPHRFPFDRWFGAVPRDVRWRDDVAATRTGQVRVRCYESRAHSRPGPLVLFFHGGGWVQGSIRGYDAVCAQVASRVAALVVSVEYRLAPEHPFPAAMEDCYDAACWAVSRAEVLGVDPSRVAVMGDSAGGNLAAVVALMARDLGGPQLAAQVLVYPGLDGTLSSPSVDRLAHSPILTRQKIADFLDRYHPDPDRSDPNLSPLLAPDLSRLPPTLIQTADHDPLLDDGSRYAERLLAAGVPVTYTEYRDVPHGFLSFPGLAASGDRPMAQIVAHLSSAFA
jgi:acetyl esterase/lipase